MCKSIKKKKGLNSSRNIVPDLDNLFLSFCLTDFELKIILNILSEFYTITLYFNFYLYVLSIF